MSQQRTYIPLITPLEGDGSVCERSVARLLASTRDWVDGFIPCLTSGEGWQLTSTQWQEMVRYTLKHADQRDVIVGIERSTTQDVLEFARLAEDMGANTIILTTPFGHAVSQHTMLEHFRRIHDDTTMSIFVYHESPLSGNECELDTLLNIADLPRVIGIKDSSEIALTQQEIAALQQRGVAYFLGWENRLVAQSAADGNIVSLSNLEPAICQQAMSSNEAEVQNRINQLCDTYSLFAEDWYYHVKKELKQRGIISSDRVTEG